MQGVDLVRSVGSPNSTVPESSHRLGLDQKQMGRVKKTWKASSRSGLIELATHVHFTANTILSAGGWVNPSSPGTPLSESLQPVRIGPQPPFDA